MLYVRSACKYGISLSSLSPNHMNYSNTELSLFKESCRGATLPKQKSIIIYLGVMDGE